MNRVLGLLTLISSISFASDTAVPEKIRGVLLVAPTELHGLQVAVSPDRKCDSKEHASFESIACDLAQASATFESKSEKSVVQIDKLLELHYVDKTPGNVSRTYSLMGNWSGSSNGYNVQSRILIDLHEYNGKPGHYTGFIEFMDLGFNKIPLDARAE